MGFFGIVKNGLIVPEPGTALVEGARVWIEAIDRVVSARGSGDGVDPADDLSRFAVRTGIPDLASGHDHYCSRASQSP